MNYTKTEKELNSIPPEIVHQYFTERTAIPGAKIHLLDKLKEYPEKKAVQPISYAYFKNNFSLLCSNYPELVISIMKVGKEEPDHLVRDLKKVSINKEITWDYVSIITLANAETLFQKAQKEVRDIVLKKDHSEERINKVISDIEQLAGAEPYQDIRRIYWMLYCELRVTLQFHKPSPNWNFTFTIGDHPEHWFKLRGENDVCALKYLSENSLDKYKTDPMEFRAGVLRSAKGDCVSEDIIPKPPTKIDEFHPTPEEQEIFKRFRDEHNIIAHSRAMLKVFKQIDTYAPSNLEILILGNRGTGKELVARAIHKISDREGKFIVLGSLTESLIESELFGIEKEIATGVKKRPGIFETAQGGTVFLDEIGDMPFKLQTRLLRVIQEKTVTRIGTTEEIKLDVRIISATNVDLDKAIESEKFRKDLYERIAGQTLIIPNLNERPGDIPKLCYFFYDKYRKKEHFKKDLPVSDNTFRNIKSLLAYRSVRKLENRIHVLVVWLKSHPKPKIRAINQFLSGKEEYSKIDEDAGFYLNKDKRNLLQTHFRNDFRWATTARKIYNKKGKRRTAEKEILSIYLKLGEKFNFHEKNVAEYLVSEELLEKDNEEGCVDNISDGYKKILSQYPSDKNNRIYYIKDKKLILKLKELRSDLT